MASAAIAIVTDSTSSLQRDSVRARGIRVVGLRVQLADRSFLEGDELTGSDVSNALLARERVSTSRPTPSDFVAEYQRAFDEGYSSVVSIHLSSALSGTCDAARVAAAGFGSRVRVIDSRTIAMGLGFSVLAAAQSAAAGAGTEDIASVVQATVRRSSVFFYVNSLQWLREGGRIGPAAARFGTALSVKPLLHVQGGDIVALEKVRTSSKAIARLVQLARAAAGHNEAEIAIQHLDTPELAVQVADQLQASLPGAGPFQVCEVGAVIGAHVGPGVIGIAVVPAG